MSFEISLSEDIAACHALRRAVFIEEQGVSEADEIDDLDGVCLHLLARCAGRPVGTARVHIKGKMAKVGRVCVLAQQRGKGLGAALIRAAVAQAREVPEVASVKLGAQVHAIGFYEALGFTAEGPVYDDAGIDHRDMVMTL